MDEGRIVGGGSVVGDPELDEHGVVGWEELVAETTDDGVNGYVLPQRRRR